MASRRIHSMQTTFPADQVQVQRFPLLPSSARLLSVRDTGGSGRCLASHNNIIGLKPTLGLLSRTDMVNASVHFDTVSIYVDGM